jgi:hypothetical protein
MYDGRATMLEHPDAATSDGRVAGDARAALLTRIQEGLAEHGPRAKARRCPCCGAPIRAGQRLTSIHGTSVHARCATRSQYSQ